MWARSLGLAAVAAFGCANSCDRVGGRRQAEEPMGLCRLMMCQDPAPLLPRLCRGSSHGMASVSRLQQQGKGQQKASHPSCLCRLKSNNRCGGGKETLRSPVRLPPPSAVTPHWLWLCFESLQAQIAILSCCPGAAAPSRLTSKENS